MSEYSSRKPGSTCCRTSSRYCNRLHCRCDNMTQYNEYRCKKLEEEHGEIGFLHFLKHFWTDGVKSHFKNFYSIDTWTSDLFSEGPLTLIKNGVIEISFGAFMFVYLLVMSVLGPIWIPLRELNKARKGYNAFQAYLNDKESDEE